MTSHDYIQLPHSISSVLKELNDNQQFILDKAAVGPKTTKRLKLDTPTKEEFSMDKSWQRVGIILDALPDCVPLQSCHQLVPILFQLLERYGMVVV